MYVRNCLKEQLKMRVSDFVMVLVVGCMVGMSIHNLATMRSFGFYQSGVCAYEDSRYGKMTPCPEQLPYKYNSHVVSPRWVIR